jgi:hypothetical protein
MSDIISNLPDSIKTLLKSADTEIVDFITQLITENRKLQKKIIKLEVQSKSQQNKINELTMQLSRQTVQVIRVERTEPLGLEKSNQEKNETQET